MIYHAKGRLSLRSVPWINSVLIANLWQNAVLNYGLKYLICQSLLLFETLSVVFTILSLFALELPRALSPWTHQSRAVTWE